MKAQAPDATSLDEFAAKKPEWIGIGRYDMTGFGSRGFGVDYDQRVLAMIRARYRLVKAWRQPDYAFVLLRRLPDPSHP